MAAGARKSVNRTPWVTYGVLAISAVALIYTQHRERQVDEDTEIALGEAVAYLESHPYLDYSALRGRVSSAGIDRLDDELERDRQRRGMPPIPAGLKRRHQEQLDDLVVEALAPLGDLPTYRMGFRPSQRDPSTYLTHPFLHTGWLHLVANGFLLLLFGFYIEHTWGSTFFALTLLAGSTAAATGLAVRSPDSVFALVGTSGMLSTLLGVYTVRFAHTWREGSFHFLWLAAAVWLLLPPWFGLEVSLVREFGAPTHRAGQISPSYWALAFGLGFGWMLAMGVRLSKLEESLSQTAAEKGANLTNAELERALEAHARGRSDEAYRVVSKLLEKDPDSREAQLAMWDIANDLGRPVDAAEAMLRAVRDEVRTGANAAAVDHWLELYQRGLEGAAEPALLIKIALLLREADQPSAAQSALRRALDAVDDDNAAVVATRVARASRDIDPDMAQDAAWRALGSLDLSLEERQQLEELLAQMPSPVRSAPRPQAPEPVSLRPEPSDHGTLQAEPVEPAGPTSTQWEDPELLDEEPKVIHDPPWVRTKEEEGVSRPTPIDLELSARQLQVVHAQPCALEPEGLLIEAESGARKRVPFGRVEAVAVVAIEGLGEKPVILVDLLLNWASSSNSEPLKLIRLRADRFDPRRFGPGQQTPLEAMRWFIERLLTKTGASPLPDLDSAKGLPFASFEDLEAYQRDVLSVDQAPEAYEWVD